jgi:predicted CXXCH cytochrome family protein
MARVIHIVLGLLTAATLFAPSIVNAQIAPGELSAAHEHLEGIGNCTRCHSLGKSISGTNCLNCHTELRSRIDAGKGFHAGIRQKPCTECHKEHHGRNFSLLRLDTKSFDHAVTGFALEGKHRSVECRKCHVKENIRATDVLKNSEMISRGTYLGLSRDCATCHVDVHKGQLSAQCGQCHANDAWKPPARFSHDRSKFRLSGKHLNAKCEGCHPPATQPGVPVRFAGLQFAACSSCHTDPHRGKFQKPCESCHSTLGWQTAGQNFNHASTRFLLRGRHAQIQCGQCHGKSSAGGTSPKSDRFHITKFQACSDCHVDPHGGQFAKRKAGGTCESCHNEQGWREGMTKTFNHATTQFPLRGKHATIDCARCHLVAKPGGAPTPRPDITKFQHCADCHTDPHDGQFAARTDKGACESCHTEGGFATSTFSFAMHEGTRLPLRGGHRAVPCRQCHAIKPAQGRDSRQFRWAGEATCATCHRDVHNGRFTGGRARTCADCHAPAAWIEVRFAHETTRFPLTGKHAGVACAKCHKTGGSGSPREWEFAGRTTRCSDCHVRSEGL